MTETLAHVHTLGHKKVVVVKRDKDNDEEVFNKPKFKIPKNHFLFLKLEISSYLGGLNFAIDFRSKVTRKTTMENFKFCNNGECVFSSSRRSSLSFSLTTFGAVAK